MAGPTFGAAGTPLTGATDTTAAVPVPASVVADSVVLVFLYRAGDLASYETVTPPAGFTLVADNLGATGGLATNHGFLADVFWHRASGAESGTYDFTFSSRFRTGVAVRFDGCRTTGDPFEVEDGARTLLGVDSPSANTPAVSVTTTGADRLLVWAGWTWGSGAWTPPTGFTSRVSTVPFDLVTVATKDQASAGSSGSLVGSQITEPHAAWTAALVAPPAPVTGTVDGSLPAITGTLTEANDDPVVLYAQHPGGGGVTPTMNPAEVNGNRVAPGVRLMVVNGGGAPVTLTLATAVTVDGLDLADREVTVPDGSFPANTRLVDVPWTLYQDPADGLCGLSWSDTSQVSVAVVGRHTA